MYGGEMRIWEAPRNKVLTKKLYRTARKKGVEYGEMKLHLKTSYGVSSTKDLTLEQYQQVMRLLHAMATLPKRLRPRNETAEQYAARTKGVRS